MQPHRRQPTRLLCPWDSPDKNTRVGCHFLLQCMKVKSESEDTQSCPTLQDPMDCSLPGSSVHGILQARVLEWIAIAFSDTLSKWDLKQNKQANKNALGEPSNIFLKNILKGLKIIINSLQSSNSTSGYIPKKIESKVSKRYFYTHIHSSTIFNGKKLEATHPSVYHKKDG